MATSHELVCWNRGCEACENKNFAESISCFENIAKKTSKIYFNIAQAFLHQGRLREAKKVMVV